MAGRPPSGARRPGASRGDGQAAGDRARPPRPHALHRYGQNHLVDGNILRLIVKQAAVGPDDVVLEVGAADGQLTRPLLERARLVHVFEIDHRYASRLTKLAAEHPNLLVHSGDALKQDLATLDPPPTTLVANLAYNIAIPLIMTTIAELPQLSRWAVMVQKELGERLFAVPSTKAYSAVSVLTQLACRREAVRAVPPAAFRPQPRVDSSFITFLRRAAAAPGTATAAGAAPPLTGAEYAAMDQLVRRAFGQRRKVLTNTLAGGARAGVTLSRDDVSSALEELGLSSAARPEELAPPQWVALAQALRWPTGETEVDEQR
ncbi:MAG: 16S rRNA (adenine(1518)-N(6)/adenine(1519)-N(6))-dimethyltransferase RsmA [Actinobacteria bacterium]|nr:16S rRNA (adenine(1518)-N(6)/adenine(1519)-N(6))-dimethyltransferase RsmA [Actinomycetota bacterium]